MTKVSICTITYNRDSYLDLIEKTIINQIYPLDLIEWIVIDDSDTNNNHEFKSKDILEIKYKRLKERTSIGKKRNIGNEMASGEIILNIAPTATHKLDLTNQDISFTGRFAGSAMEIWLPIKNVLAIFAKENGQGVIFKDGSNLEQKSKHISKDEKGSHMASNTMDRFAIVGRDENSEQLIKKRKSGTGKKKKAATFLKRVK